jgi:glycine cleavage system aminomethyltransferase T
LLSRLQLEGSTAPKPQTPVISLDGKEIGWITSAAFSPRLGEVIALGYLKRAYAEAGKIHRLDPGDGVLRNVEVVDRFF